MDDALIDARGIGRVFRQGSRWWPGGGPGLQALRDVSLTIAPGTSVGLVGESGSGKTTLARILVGLDRPGVGQVLWRGRATSGFSRADWRGYWHAVQYVFQDAHSALNPRHRVRRILAMPLAALPAPARRARVAALLEQVGLAPELADHYPHQLSGGQAQRVVLARALAVQPQLLILDEPVSALDVSIQAQILALLRELRHDLDLGYLFVSHDLAVVEQLCDEVVVMKEGRVVERGRCDAVFGAPRQAYTRALLEAAQAKALRHDRGAART